MEKSNLTTEQQLIADVILSYYEAAVIEDYDEMIEIDQFIDLWAPINRPKLAEIEEVLLLLGFKDEEARLDLKFIVNVKELDNKKVL